MIIKYHTVLNNVQILMVKIGGTFISHITSKNIFFFHLKIVPGKLG